MPVPNKHNSENRLLTYTNIWKSKEKELKHGTRSTSSTRGHRKKSHVKTHREEMSSSVENVKLKEDAKNKMKVAMIR